MWPFKKKEVLPISYEETGAYEREIKLCQRQYKIVFKSGQELLLPKRFNLFVVRGSIWDKTGKLFNDDETGKDELFSLNPEEIVYIIDATESNV